MTDQHGIEKSKPELEKGKDVKSRGTANPASFPPCPGADVTPAAGESDASSRLTPDEQMALYEKDLKENDWGHQPC